MPTALWPGLKLLLGYTPPATPAYRRMPAEIRVDVSDEEAEEVVCFVCNKAMSQNDRSAVEPAAALHTCGCEPLIHPGCYREWWLANGRCPQCNTESALHDVVKFVIRGTEETADPAGSSNNTNRLAYVGLTMLAMVGSVAAVVLGTNNHGCTHHHQEAPPTDDDGWLMGVGVGINAHP